MEKSQQLDLTQTVRLLLEFLRENHLAGTMAALSEETGVQYSYVDPEVVESARRGAWQSVLKALSTTRVDRRAVARVQEQIVKELLLEREHELSATLLKEWSMTLSEPIRGMGEGHLLQQLWDLTQTRDPPHTVATVFKGIHATLSEAREECAQTLQEHVVQDVVPPNRLVHLLALGLEYEKLLAGGQALVPSKKVGREQEVQINYLQRVKSHKIFSGEFKVQSIAISNSSQFLALGGQDGLIEVWDYATMALDLTNLPYQAQDLYMLHHKPVLSLTFSKDDKILASGDAEGLIRVWKFADGKKLRELDTQTIGVACLAFISSSSLVAGCLDKSVRIYGLKSGNLLKNLKGHDSFLLSVQPLSDNLLLSAAEDGGMLLWNVAEPTDCLVKRLKLPSLGKDVIFGNCEARGNEVLMCARFKSCYLVDLDSNKVLMDYQSNQSKEEEMLYARFSPDGLYVYALASSRNLYVFDKRSGKLLNLISVPTAKPEVAGVETGPNGTMIVFDLGELFKLD